MRQRRMIDENHTAVTQRDKQSRFANYCMREFVREESLSCVWILLRLGSLSRIAPVDVSFVTDMTLKHALPLLVRRLDD